MDEPRTGPAVSARRTLVTQLGPASGTITAPDAPTGILLGVHGAGHAAESFGPLFASPALADTLRFALDLPGRHGSIGPVLESASAAARFAAAALEARETLETLEADADGESEPPSLRRIAIGHSYGGAVALELALAGAVDACVMISSGARLRVRPELLASLEAVARAEAPRARGIGFAPSTDAAFVDALEQAFDAVTPETALGDWRAADAFDRLAELGRVAVPTLVIGGDADPFTPLRYAEFLAERIPNARLHRLAGGSHMALVERPEEIAEAIASFVAETRAAPSR